MSNTAGIDFTFHRGVTVGTVLDALAVAGWTPVEPKGISYLIDHDEDYAWQSTHPGNLPQVREQLDAPRNRSATVGISIYRKDAETGGLLLLPPPRNELSFTANLHRRTVPAAQRLTDLAWYLREMLPALLPLGLTGYTAQDLAG